MTWRCLPAQISKKDLLKLLWHPYEILVLIRHSNVTNWLQVSADQRSMLHRPARKLLARTHVLHYPFWSNESLLNAFDSSASASRVPARISTGALDRDHSPNGDRIGYHWPTPGKEKSWGQQTYSTGFRKVEALQQGMAEMVPHVVPIPSDIRHADLVVNRSDHLKVSIAHKLTYVSTFSLKGVQWSSQVLCREVTINKISSLTGKAQIGSHWTQVWGCIHWPHASSLLERGARLDRPFNWPAGPTDTSPLCSGKQL